MASWMMRRRSRRKLFPLDLAGYRRSPARGIGVERLRDLPAESSRQFEALGLNPECS
jgi:hypothetical protein